MKRLILLSLLIFLFVAAKPRSFSLSYDYGITPNDTTSWVKIGGTSSLDACPLDGDHAGCEPCFGEDNQWKRGWEGDLDGTFVVGTSEGIDLNICPWGTTASLYYRVRLPRRYDAVLTSGGVQATDRGDIGNGRHEYVGCRFQSDGIAGRQFVALTTKARDVYLDVAVLVDETARTWCATYSP